MPELTSRSDLYGEANLNVELDEEKLKQVRIVVFYFIFLFRGGREVTVV